MDWLDYTYKTGDVPYACRPDDKPKITSTTDDGNIDDSKEGPYTICAEVWDKCTIATYCYEIPKEVWIEEVGREMHWWVNATASNGKNDLEGAVLGGLISDDDEEYPEFSNPTYTRRPMYNESMTVVIGITDESVISSTNLTYDYDYSTGIDGFDDNPTISGNTYTFTIPAACPGETDPNNCEYKWRNMKFWIEATDNDTDRPDDKISVTFTSPDGSESILIDPPEIEFHVEVTHDPYIFLYGPSQSSITVKECSYYPFIVDAEDPDGDILVYSWYVDGEKVAYGKEFTYQTQAGDIGEHEVKVIVSDREFTDEHVWTVNVISGECEEEEPTTTTTIPTTTTTQKSDGGDSSSDGTVSGGGSLSGSSSSGGGGGSIRSTTTTTEKVEETTTTLEPIVVKDGQREETEQETDEKKPTTGNVVAANFKYTFLSFMVTLVVVGVPLFFFGRSRKFGVKPE